MKWPLTQIEAIHCAMIRLSKLSTSPGTSFPFKPPALTLTTRLWPGFLPIAARVGVVSAAWLPQLICV